MTLPPAEPVAAPVYDEPVYEESVDARAAVAEPEYEEAPMSMAASASATPPAPPSNGPVPNGSATEPLFNNLDVPAILRRDRRLVQ